LKAVSKVVVPQDHGFEEIQYFLSLAELGFILTG
jgi:hypothetical protein